MKKLFAFITALLISSTALFAQKIGYFDNQQILDKSPKYKEVQQEIEALSTQWQSELEQMYKEIDQLYQEYTEEEVLLSQEARQQRQDEIFQKERAAKQFKDEKFGQEGELFQIQDEKMKPLLDKIETSVEKIAKQKGYNFVFDKSANAQWVYTDETYDLTPAILKDLGLE